jgi:peptidoglycan-associated lipoprotein
MRRVFLAVLAVLLVTSISGCKKPKRAASIPSSGPGAPGAGWGEGIPLSAMPDSLVFEEITDPEMKAIFDDIHFDYDDSSIKDSERPILENIGVWLKDNPAVVIQVEGHCDERGSNEYNLALGERRALSVRGYLATLGVEPGKIYTISYGEERPVDPGHDESAWWQNRRAHFMVAPK